MQIYPEYKWLPWKFNMMTHKIFWNDKNNQKVFLDYVAKELNFMSKEDWYTITEEVIYKLSIFNYYKENTKIRRKNFIAKNI